MASFRELRGIAHNLAHHSQSGLSWLYPHLRQVCRRAGVSVASFNLLPHDPYPADVPQWEPLRLALASLRVWFLELLAPHGHDQSNLCSVTLTFRFRDDDGSNPAVRATISTNTGKERHYR